MAPDLTNPTNNNTIYHIRGYKLINGSVQNIDCNIQSSREQIEELIKVLDISIENQEIVEEKGAGNNITAILEIDNMQLYRSHQDVAKAAYTLMLWGFPLHRITDTNKPLSSAQSDRLIQKVKASIEKNNNDTMQKNRLDGTSQKESQESIVQDSNTNSTTIETTHTENTGPIVENETEGSNDWLETIQQRQKPETKSEPTNTEDNKEITLENIQGDSTDNNKTQIKTINENINIQTIEEKRQENDKNQVVQTTGEINTHETRTNNTNRNQVAQNLISDLQTFIGKAGQYSLSSIPYLQQQLQQLQEQLSTGEPIQQRQIETLMQQMEQGELELVKLQQQQEIAQDIKTGNFKQEQNSKSNTRYSDAIGEVGVPSETITEKRGIRLFLTHTIKWTIIVATLESGLITYRYMLQQNSLGEGPSAMIILGRIGLGYSGRTVVKKNKKMPIQILALVLTIAIVYLIITQIQKQF